MTTVHTIKCLLLIVRNRDYLKECICFTTTTLQMKSLGSYCTAVAVNLNSNLSKIGLLRAGAPAGALKSTRGYSYYTLCPKPKVHFCYLEKCKI